MRHHTNIQCEHKCSLHCNGNHYQNILTTPLAVSRRDLL